MVFMLVIADALVPSLAKALPSRLSELLKPGRIATVLCLGNCSREIIGTLKRVTNDVKCVRGDHDNDDTLPETRILEIEGLKLGMCHGHQIVPQGDEAALLALQRKLGVDVLLTASTHQLSVRQTGGVLLLDPGSATGASTLLHESPPPSFIVMDVTAGKVLMWTYSMLGEKLDIQRHVYTKRGFEVAPASAPSSTAGESPPAGQSPPPATPATATTTAAQSEAAGDAPASQAPAPAQAPPTRPAEAPAEAPAAVDEASAAGPATPSEAPAPAKFEQLSLAESDDDAGERVTGESQPQSSTEGEDRGYPSASFNSSKAGEAAAG